MPATIAFALALHTLAAVIWVGGMFFAYLCLRPVAAATLEPPQRLTLWRRTLSRFFVWVWVAAAVLFASGLWMAITLFGGMGKWPWSVHAMFGGALVMFAIFLYVVLWPFAALGRAVDAQDWKAAAAGLAGVRRLVGVNLILGLLVVVSASAGRFL